MGQQIIECDGESITVTASTEAGHRRIDPWRIAYIVILLLALATRLYALGDRAVSHDETTHAKYSWNPYIDEASVTIR